MTYFTIALACMLSTFTQPNENQKTETIRKPATHVQMDQLQMDQILKQGIADLEKFQQRKNRSRIG